MLCVFSSANYGCLVRQEREKQPFPWELFCLLHLGSFCIGCSLLLSPDDVMMLCQGRGAVWRWMVANKEAERQGTLLSTSCLSPKAFALCLHPCQVFRVTQGLSNLPCTAVMNPSCGEWHKGGRAFSHKKMLTATEIFNPKDLRLWILSASLTPP